MLGKVRRGRFDRPAAARDHDAPEALPPRPALTAGWDHTARPVPAPSGPAPELPLRAQILSLFSDPRIDSITIEGVVEAIRAPRQDIETTLDAMVQAGELRLDASAREGAKRYCVSTTDKQRLEAMFRDAAVALGEQGVLARSVNEDALVALEDETDEPRLPVTAGLLSLFLPGTGQLLNGDVGRASLVFAVWSLAWITHLSPVWTFVCLYAGAEAFFTAKIRSMERKMAKEALTGTNAPPQLPAG